MPIGNRKSKIGNLYSVAGGPPRGPASCEFLAEAMGKGTWRSRDRARQGRPGASRAYPAAPFRAEATSPPGIASNFHAVTLSITYQEIKGGMHGDLTKSDLDEALLSQGPGKAATRREGRACFRFPRRKRASPAAGGPHSTRGSTRPNPVFLTFEDFDAPLGGHWSARLSAACAS